MMSQEEIRKHAGGRQGRGRKARIGFIGAGWWATTNHMPLLAARSDVEMVSVCGLEPEILRRCQRDFGFRHTTTNYREVLEQELDGIVVASPHSLHAEHALASLKAGMHVLVEKPFATSAAAAREIVRLAKRKRRHVVVAFGWNFRPIAKEAMKIMGRGALGKIEFVLCHMASPLRNLFAGKSFDFSDGAYVDSKISTWADPRISHGGYGQGQLSHALGLMFALTGLRARSAFANMSRPGARVDMYDAISVRFAGGAVGSVSGAATLPPGTPGAFQLDVRIFGEKGVLVVDIARDHLSLHTNSGRHQTIPLKAGDGSYQCDGPPNRFVELILGLSSRNEAPGEVGERTVEVLDAAYRSSASGRVETV